MGYIIIMPRYQKLMILLIPFNVSFRRPVFPYFIGNTFKSKVDNFIYRKNSNQDDYDLNASSLLRNRNPYNFESQTSSYNFLDDPTSRRVHASTISAIHKGSVDEIEIVEAGDNYNVGDTVYLNLLRMEDLHLKQKSQN